jgi:DNA modification methylase
LDRVFFVIGASLGMADGLMRVRILGGDCREVLPTLAAGSVQCCVSSPPYWGLRDYGTAGWEGGSVWCEHKFDHSKREAKAKNFVNGDGRATQSCTSWTTRSESEFHRDCPCGARRIDAQLGLEATPEEYIEKMVAVFREVKRVLRDDGTLWVNMGDSYATGGAQTTGYNEPDWIKTGGACNGGVRTKVGKSGLKPKDLCMMPSRLALALQADGWYLRSEIVWHKPNPMPESVTDRPTKAHEMIYLLAKQERYFYDAEAIREPHIDINHPNRGNGEQSITKGLNQGWHGNGFPITQRNYDPRGRNKRSVWTIPTQPYSQAHFATFPEEIPKLCILAGSRVGDTVLDPFAGSGTVGRVALELGRRAVLIELNPAYVELASERTFVTPGFL